jgi:gluconate 5-dehydrogenase
MNELKGVRVVITGATSGLGLAMADALLNAGATVAMAARPSDRLKEIVDVRRSQNLDAHDLPLDVRSLESVKSATDEIFKKFGSVDVLVNNAGIGMISVNRSFLTNPMPFYEVSLDKFKDVIDTNLTGYFLVASLFTPRLLQQGHGRIINISMNHETMKRSGFVPYGPSRAAAESLSYIMAQDLAGSSLTVNILLPGGATRTGMIPMDIPAELDAKLLSPQIMDRPIIFLCSKLAETITGERIVASQFDDWLLARNISTI